jgi:plastocyanin
MNRLSVVSAWLVGIVTLLALVAVPAAGPAVVEASPSDGTESVLRDCAGMGMFPWPGSSPGIGMFPGFGGCASLGPLSGMRVGDRAVATPTQRVRLAMGDNYFFPAEISVPVGTQVAWVNSGRNPHTTTVPGVWDSGTLNPGGRWAAIFAVAGTFDYLCTIHPDEMRGRLIVTLP